MTVISEACAFRSVIDDARIVICVIDNPNSAINNSRSVIEQRILDTNARKQQSLATTDV